MFEFELSAGSKTSSQIPGEVVAVFKDNTIDYPYRSVSIWEEHCTECAYPDCYKTCDLFEPRRDGNCRRFVAGVVRIDGLASGGGPVVEVTFKRWANMFAKGINSLVSQSEAIRLEDKSRRWSDLLRRVPDGGIHVNGWPGPFVRIAKRMRRRATNRIMAQANTAIVAEAFVMAIYIPAPGTFDATLTISNGENNSSRNFQKRIVLDPGYHRVDIPITEIAEVNGEGRADFVSLIPNTEGQSADKIYLGFLGFVSSGDAKTKPSKAIKIMVWDLDHTMWNGILVENGVEGLTLKPGVAEIVKILDSRGIVNSIASKNDPELALAALKHFGIDEYFVFPQINWGPKSQSIKQIIADFNIGANVVTFIDDQPFERSEVESVLPEVRTYDAADYQTILERPEFNPEVSSESASRRLHYINEGARRASKSAHDDDGYESFLRDCDLQMQILQGEGQNIDRIYELTQRTNQMNFSGTRHTREDIARIMSDASFDTFSLRCQDKFGDYGTVGFGLVALPQSPDTNPVVVDLAFSCRVQSKRAEHAFFAWLAQNYRAQGIDTFEVHYVPTDRNKAVAAVFDDMGFIAAKPCDDARTIMMIATDQPDMTAYPWNITHQDHRKTPMKDAK